MSSLSIATRGLISSADSRTLTLATLGFLSFSSSQVVGIAEADLIGRIIPDPDFTGRIIPCNITGNIVPSISLRGQTFSCDLTGKIPTNPSGSYSLPTNAVEGYELFKPIPITANMQRSRNLQGVIQYTTTMEIIQPGAPENFSGDPINTYTYESPIDVS